ncbi:DinB family protein [Candidatus Bathyarchaeota archaeon]|nr:MAG: DinB family protein [Candidatus Bathyarchaeota archaeon]
MKEEKLLSTRLQQTFTKSEKYGPNLGEGSFHGPSLMEALEGIDAEMGRKYPIPGRHSVWEIANHCTFWMDEYSNVLQGHDKKAIHTIEDWPPQGTTDNDWKKDLQRLEESYHKLKHEIEKTDESQLDKTIQSIFHEKTFTYTVRKMLYGAIDHNLYHAGQISILKQ